MSITVSMPWYGSPELLERAVGSVLAQTYADLRLVVVGDGARPPLDHVADDRLTVLTLDQNRGPYYASAVVLAACDTEWWTPHDADDWSDPGRFAHLLAASDGYDVVFGGILQHEGSRTSIKPFRFHRASHKLRHLANHVAAIYRTDALRRIGGPHPEHRVAYDTMMVALVVRGLRWRHLAGDLSYHRQIHAASLTRDPRTGLASAYREASRAPRDALWERIRRAPIDDWVGILAPSPAVAAQVASDAARLRGLMGRTVAA